MWYSRHLLLRAVSTVYSSGSRVTVRWVRITTVVRKKLLIRHIDGILQNQICLSMTYRNLYTGSG
jgi:hypothetical protein